MPGKNFEVKRLYVVNPGSEDERVHEGLRTVCVGGPRKEFSITRLNNKRGVLDDSGKEIVPAIYDELSITTTFSPWDKNLITATLDGKKGLIALDGKELLPCEFEHISRIEYERQLVIITKHQKSGEELSGVVEYGLDGEPIWREILPIQYEDVIICDNGFQIKKASCWGFADSQGREIVPCRYYRSFSLSNEYNPLELYKEHDQILAYDFCTQDGTIVIADFVCKHPENYILEYVGEPNHFCFMDYGKPAYDFHIDFQDGEYRIVYE